MKRLLLFVVSILLIFSLVSCSGKSTDKETNSESDNSSTAKEETNSSSNENNNSGKKEESEDMAPDFTLMSSEGKKVTLSSLKGKPVHLVVWSVG